MSTLSKDINVYLVDPGTPGTPGTAPRDAYCVDTPITTFTYHMQYIPPGTPGWSTSLWGTYVVVFDGSTTTTQHVCYPGTAGTPGTPGTAPVTSLEFHLGWSGSAVSVSELTADGVYLFSVPADSVGVVTGFNDYDTGSGYLDINYAFYCHDGTYEVIENGVTINVSGVFAGTDVFGIRRLDTEVAYFVNSTKVYTSDKRSRGSVFADASLYFGGDKITGASLAAAVPATLAANSGGISGTLTAPIGFAATDQFGINGKLTRLTGYIEPLTQSTSAGSFVLVGTAGNSSGIKGRLTTLTGTIGGNQLTPQFVVVSQNLTPVNGFAVGLGGNIGTVVGTLPGLTSYLSDFNFAKVAGSFTLAGKILQIAPSNAVLVGPSPTLYATGTAGTLADANGARLTGPSPTLVAFGAATARLRAPRPTLVASGTMLANARASLTGPSPVLTASGHDISQGAAYLTLAPFGFRVVAYGGCVATLAAPRPTLVASGTTGSVAHAQLVAPLFKLLASGTTGAVGRANLVGPALRALLPSTAILYGPRPRLVASGGVLTAAFTEAYALNLANNAVSHYTGFPFLNIVRFGDDYYGIAADGVYLLGGDKDAGVPIAWTFTTGSSAATAGEDTALTVSNRKRLEKAWLSGSFAGQITVSVTTDLNTVHNYTYRPVTSTPNTHPVPLARGTTGFHFQLGVRGKGAFGLDRVTMLQRSLARKA